MFVVTCVIFIYQSNFSFSLFYSNKIRVAGFSLVRKFYIQDFYKVYKVSLIIFDIVRLSFNVNEIYSKLISFLQNNQFCNQIRFPFLIYFGIILHTYT